MAEMKIAILFISIAINSLLLVMMRSYKNSARIHLYVFSILWLSLLAIEPFIGESYNISIGTYVLFCLTIVLFNLGSFFALPFFYFSENKTLELPTLYDFVVLKNLFYIIVILSILSNIFYYKTVIGQLGNITESLALLRTETAIDAKIESSNFFFNTFGRMYNIYLPIAFYLYKNKKLRVGLLIGVTIISLLIAAASLTRAPVLNVFIIILVCIYTLKIKIKKAALGISAAVIFGLLYFSTKEIEKLTGTGEFNFIQTIAYYFLGGMKSFESLLHGHYHPSGIYDSPYYSLDFLNYFLKRFGVIESYPPLERTYSDQIYTNVYTYLDAFTLDWGIIGLVLCPLLIGFLCSFFACRVKISSNWVHLVMYCYCCYAIAISFMNNEFIRSSFFVTPALAMIFSVIASKKSIDS